MQIVAADHGGRDVINRKAAHGLGSDVIVIDVWVKSASVARSKKEIIGDGSVTVQYSDGSVFKCSNTIVVARRPSLAEESPQKKVKYPFKFSSPKLRDIKP